MALRLHSAAVTHVGMKRSENQDAVLERPDISLWAVADGMGGHANGREASQAVVECLRTLPAAHCLQDDLNRVEDALFRLHDDLFLRGSANDKVMGTTLVMLMAEGELGLLLWIGDSRIYRMRGQLLTQLTKDHSYVQKLIAQGELREEVAEQHPMANVLTRAIGAKQEVVWDLELIKLQVGDRYLLCSDGLYRDVDEAAIAASLRNADPDATCQNLCRQALEGGGNDNISILVVSVEDDPLV